MPIYEYQCPIHGVFELFVRSVPRAVRQLAKCPVPFGIFVCRETSPLIPSLGVYGDAQLKGMLRLSRERRRYHDRAEEREAVRRDVPRMVSVDPDGVPRVKRRDPVQREQVEEFAAKHGKEIAPRKRRRRSNGRAAGPVRSGGGKSRGT